jgi:hypothetical protein
MPEPLDKIAREFRAAVLAGDHVLAERLAVEYRTALAEAWRDLPESVRAASPLPALAHEMLTWARGMTIVQRAVLAEQLAVLDKSIRYASDRASSSRSTIQVSL